MSVIYKYKLNEEVLLPKEAKILSVQEQEGELFLWAIIDSSELLFKRRRFELLYTGQPFDYKRSGYTFICTVLMSNGLVVHVFEIN